MMKSIVEEKLVSFKTLEQNIFSCVCELGREITRIMLESYDTELSEGRDKKRYRDKGKRTTTIKTVYGEVTYARRVYQTELEDGRKAFVYLLDKAMSMDKIGLISTNLAEKIAMAVTESPYRVTAEAISGTCGQSISHGGAWNLVQRLGERVREEEDHDVERMETGQAQGKAGIPVLFEEMDGVWLSMQDSAHKKMKKQELKVFTMYEGWDTQSKGCSRLVNKGMLAGMEASEEFHRKREALIEKRYDADEIGQRILNGDGGGWIREPYDDGAIFQLDRFHIYQEIKRKLKEKEAEKAVTELFEARRIEEMLEYIQIYADSVASNDPADKRSSNAMKLYEYLSNNKGGLLPYQERGIKIPEAIPGVVYKNMGVQENQNCTVVTLRMKHRRMRWSVAGANNLSKLLYRKENRELIDTIERYTDGLVSTMEIGEVLQVLSAAKAPKKDGKGSAYVEAIKSHVPLKDAMMTASRKAFKSAFCS